GSLRHQLWRSVLQPPKERTSQGKVSHPPPWLRMEKEPRNRPQQLRSRRVWSRKSLIRCSRKRSSFPPTFAAFRLRPVLWASKLGREHQNMVDVRSHSCAARQLIQAHDADSLTSIETPPPM